MTEFELIRRFFESRASPDDRGRIVLGIGDDCALLAMRRGHVLAISTDMLVAGRHFFDDVDPAALGWKTLAVNLSDLAAMGARPVAFTLALALPSIDATWLERFAVGLFECAAAYDCALIGGDTTRGPLTLSVTVFGDVVEGAALTRSAAREGDDLWVSGTLGGAALALHALRTAAAPIDARLRAALERPMPRVRLGEALAGVAHAAIDVSDGLAQDLGHVLRASGRGADLWLDALPVDPALASLEAASRWSLALAGGDDYELCFTAPPERRTLVEQAGRSSGTALTRVGTVTTGSALRIVDAQGADSRPADPAWLAGFDHFR